jgi:hypothetical protein
MTELRIDTTEKSFSKTESNGKQHNLVAGAVGSPLLRLLRRLNLEPKRALLL